MRVLGTFAAALFGAVALTGCHMHYREPATDVDPAGAWGASLEPGERARLIETDALIVAQAAAARADRAGAEKISRDAREFGFSDAGALTAALERECLETAEIRSFAAARGLSEETAARYLAARFGAAACGASAR